MNSKAAPRARHTSSADGFSAEGYSDIVRETKTCFIRKKKTTMTGGGPHSKIHDGSVKAKWSVPVFPPGSEDERPGSSSRKEKRSFKDKVKDKFGKKDKRDDWCELPTYKETIARDRVRARGIQHL